MSKPIQILVPNLGSTSLKFQVLAMPSEQVQAKGRLERVKNYREAVAGILAGDYRFDAVAFKTVHAGPRYRGTFLIDENVLAAMEEYLPAAPAHNAIYLEAIRAFRETLPSVPLVAAFETEFHATMPPCASRYGVPGWWRRQHGIERYGFHGASHRYIAERTAALLGRPLEELRTVSCHLGGSSSICAIEGGRSIDTTMGFSPQSGLENATRCGDVDVFAVLFMMDKHGWTTAEARRQLAQNGGLAGLSGIAGGDVRDLEQAAAAGDQDARLALELFAYQVRKTIGAYAAAMGGLDAVAFTGGIGENSASLRRACCRGLEFLGIYLEAAKNETGAGDRLISPAGAPVAVLALATNEELVVARRAYRLLAG